MANTAQSCHRCHRVNPPAAAYCGMCGARLRSAGRQPCCGGLLRTLVWIAVIGLVLACLVGTVRAWKASRWNGTQWDIYPGRDVRLQQPLP